MKKFRLTVFNTQPPHLYYGGVERRIVETAKRLKAQVDITVYSGTKSGFHDPTYIEGARVVPCFSTDFAFPFDNWVFNHSLTRTAKRIDSDVFESHAVSGYAFLKQLRKRKSKTHFIQTVHGVLADEYLQTTQSSPLSLRENLANYFMWQLSRLEGETARNADVVVTVSNYSLKRIVQLYGVEEPKIRVAPNGVDPERFKPVKDEEVKAKYGLIDKQVVLFVGRLIPRKGLKHLLEAAVTILKENQQAAFVIVGNGPLRKYLDTELERLNISKHFKFLGDVKDEDLPSIYNCSDVFMLPSIQEGQGIALLEAQASAKPVTAFNVSGVPEALVEGTSGCLVEKGNSEALAQVILNLLSNRHLREKMGAKGREFVLRNFTWDICASKMLSIYKQELEI